MPDSKNDEVAAGEGTTAVQDASHTEVSAPYASNVAESQTPRATPPLEERNVLDHGSGSRSVPEEGSEALTTGADDIKPRMFELVIRGIGFLENLRSTASQEGVQLLRERNEAQRATADARIRADEQQQRHERHLAWVQLAGLVGVVAVTAGLAYAGRLDATVASVLGTVAGYLFGRRQDAETRSRS